MARGKLACSSSCDPEAGEQMAMSQTSPALAGPDSRPPGSGSLAVLAAVPVGMSSLLEPRPVPLALRACWALWAPREHTIQMRGPRPYIFRKIN